MRDLKTECRLAVVQARPIMFNKGECVRKAVRLIDECAANGAELIVFPELFIPGYPYGMTFGFTVGSRNEAGRRDWKMYYDNPEWQDTIRHIAIEGHCYFINCDMFFERADYPETDGASAEIAALPDVVCRGGSCVIDPFGHLASDTVWDREDVIYADLDMQKVPASRMEHDVCGHYARSDILHLEIK